VRTMGAGLSDREAAAFAVIADRFGDGRWLRRTGVALGSCFLAVAVPVLLVVLRWPWAAVVSFAVTFLVGLAAGLVLVARRCLGRSQ
jgi:hypothetical protein